jgi:hypothetical protein
MDPFVAHAASGLYLTWNDCALGGGASNMDFGCDVNDGQEDLVCAFTMPIATGADVIGIVAVIDFQSSAADLPAWWQLAKSGGCRSGNLDASADFSGGTGCVDPWQGRATAIVQGFDTGAPRPANQARIKVACGVVPDSARTLDDTSMYYGVRVILRNGLTTGSVACAGCAQTACLVLNSIEVSRTPGAPGGDLFLQTPGPGNANWAMWRGGTGADCTLVPVRRTTWGGLKSLYR